MDSLDSPSVNRTTDANTMAAIDLTPHDPLLLSVNDSDVGLAGRSLQQPNVINNDDAPRAETIAPPDPSRYQYDIV